MTSPALCPPTIPWTTIQVQPISPIARSAVRGATRAAARPGPVAAAGRARTSASMTNANDSATVSGGPGDVDGKRQPRLVRDVERVRERRRPGRPAQRRRARSRRTRRCRLARPAGGSRRAAGSRASAGQPVGAGRRSTRTATMIGRSTSTRRMSSAWCRLIGDGAGRRGRRRRRRLASAPGSRSVRVWASGPASAGRARGGVNVNGRRRPALERAPSSADSVVQRTSYATGLERRQRERHPPRIGRVDLAAGCDLAAARDHARSSSGTASRAWVNVITISVGATSTVDASAGSAVSSSAWPRTAAGRSAASTTTAATA